MSVDQDRLMEFLHTFVGDLGATAAAASGVVGDELGLYRGLLEGPASAGVLAARTDTDPRYVTEWARGQAAGGYLTYDAGSDTYSLTEEQAFALTDPTGPVFLPGAFQLALGAVADRERIAQGFRTGEGMGWHEHGVDVFDGCERFFRPGYLANLVPSWIPALDGVAAKLNTGAAVASPGSAGPRKRRSTSCSRAFPDTIRACVTDPAGCRAWRCRARHPARRSTPSRWSRSTSCT
jgi:hypothetical protein